MSSVSNVPVSKAKMHVPPLEEAARVLSKGLSKNFANVSVKVVDCPDLTQEPFDLSAKGICGSPRLADVGGPPFLIPLVQRQRKYNMVDVSKMSDLPGAFMIGPGAGPFHHVGTNSELICNVKIDDKDPASSDNKSYSCRMVGAEKYHLEKLGVMEFCLLGNFLCCEGKPGKVLEVLVSKRTGPDHIMDSLSKSLLDHYKTDPVALGGTFLVERGKAYIHIMPDFSEVPLNSDAEVDQWLKFFEMDAPLVCVGELVSHDPGLDLRMEHFHCFSNHGDGGHFHWDTTPDEVSYRGYFSLAEFIYRIDQPTKTHHIGRDKAH